MPPDAPAIRPATRADLPAIMALLADDPFSVAGRDGGPAAEAAGAAGAAEAAFARIERDPGSRVYVLELDGRVIGCAQLTVIPGLARRGLTRGLVEAVRVASDLRGRGHGRAFLRQLADLARRDGCGLLQLTSDKRRTDAHRFYRSLGFRMSHEGFKLGLE